MGYYDDDYEEQLNCIVEHIAPVLLVAEDCTESDITNALVEAGLVPNSRPRLACDMEKMVFVYGNENEVYTPEEIHFTESIDKVFVYQDFSLKLRSGRMICRVVAAKINSRNQEALKTCITFEKISNKAFDGFNIFFFITEDSVFFGCKLFDKNGAKDCTLSSPIKGQDEFEQYQNELTFLNESSDFMDYYDYCLSVIDGGILDEEDYETAIIKKRGIQTSYIEDLDKIERRYGLDMTQEKERYRGIFDAQTESYASLITELNESLSYIKSNRVNTYELLFEADEMLRAAENAEQENDKIIQQDSKVTSFRDENYSLEYEELPDDPEEIIKILKKQRGI